MYTKIFIVTIFFFLCFDLMSQTSIEEYNYLTKGYKIQLESGLDMKKGYELRDIDAKKTNERSAELKALVRTSGSEGIVAAYLVVYNRRGNETEYICIPHPNSEEEILEKYWTQLHHGSMDSSQRLQLILFLISRQIKW